MIQKILNDKSLEEQQKLKSQWEKERLENEKKLEKQQKDFDNKMAKWNEEQQKLMSIEEIKTGIEAMMKELDMKWDEAVKSFVAQLFKNSSEEAIEIYKRI